MEVVEATGAVCCVKLQSYRHHQQTNAKLFTGRMPFLSPNQQCQSTEGLTEYDKNTVYYVHVCIYVPQRQSAQTIRQADRDGQIRADRYC